VNYLLDTHTLIWIISEKNKLSSAVVQCLADPGNTFYVSAISFWEIALKFSRGKLEIAGVLPEELQEISILSGFKLILLSPDETSTFSGS
jgi:PIN domain nuclease of toxin-antitoxin system